jgi:hypothetical protein
MILFLSILLFIVYFVVKVRQFIKEKEWKDLFVFVLISVIAGFFLVIHKSNWNIGYPIEYLYSITEPISRKVFPAIFGIQV